MKRDTKFRDLSNVSQGVIVAIFLFKIDLFDYIKNSDSNPRFSNERSQVFGQIMNLTLAQFSSKWRIQIFLIPVEETLFLQINLLNFRCEWKNRQLSMGSAKDEVLRIKRAKNDKVSKFLTPTLAEIDITHLGYWSLRRPFSFNLQYIDLFRNF